MNDVCATGRARSGVTSPMPGLARTPLPVRRLLAALLVVLASLALSATRAEAWTPYPYKTCASPGGWRSQVCVAWTGGYPHGVVRAESPSSEYYAVKLMTCSNAVRVCNDDVDAASATLNKRSGHTASVRVGKYSWYIACAKWLSSSKWACNTGTYRVYLGD